VVRWARLSREMQRSPMTTEEALVLRAVKRR